MASKIKILCLSLWFPLTMSRYFEKAFRHREDLDFKTCGVYTGAWIPWNFGMELPTKYAIPPDFPLPFRPDVGQINYEIVKAQLGDWIPDIVLTIDAGICWKYKPSDGLVVHIATDPHVLNYDYQRTISDKFFSMQASYMKSNDEYLPYAYSKYDFYPEEFPVRYTAGGQLESGWAKPLKDLDAALIGLQYTHVPRVQCIEELKKRGLNVFTENGPVFDEARAIYNRARIGLNWSTLDDLNCRAFELPAMKLAPVMNLVSDIGKFFVQGEHYLGFRELPEAIENVMWLKEHPLELNQLAERAYQNVLPHTFDARVEQILRTCGFVTSS